MKLASTTLFIFLGIISILAVSGCGTDASDPTMPGTENTLTSVNTSETGGHGIIGVYDLMFDPDAMDLKVMEARGADAHYDITYYIAPYVSASLISWDPVTRILDFKLAITNPSLLDVYDVRTLFLTDSSSGFELLNPDDFTELFNPFAPGTVNPFRTYAKLALDREFGAGATYEEFFSVQCPPTWGASAKFLVECSWPGPCEDVYEISNQALSNPVSGTVSGTITLDAYDHQNNINAVSIDTIPITGGLTWLANTGGTNWEAVIINSAGAAPGVYRCRIAADSMADPWDLYDFLNVFVIPTVTVPKWHTTDYPINAGSCSYDLGVIADPGGPRDSEILMVDPNSDICGRIIKYDPYYVGWSNYVDLKDYDSANLNYQPYPVLRLDAADDGAFSFTNDNDLPYPDAASDVRNSMIWSVFDNFPKLHLGPIPDEGRYYFDFMAEYDAETRPEDVCDDFTLGQYALFSTGVMFTPRDLILLGTMPDSYTYDKVRYLGNLDPWAGVGGGHVNPAAIQGIDVIERTDDSGASKYATVYILENFGGFYQVEVFNIFDTSPLWIEDLVNWVMTIDIALPGTPVDMVTGHDIEILPVNSGYLPNTINPNLCVLVSYELSGETHGEVLLYDAVTGAIVDSIGDIIDPSMPKSEVYFLDTDDDDWEIHVTREDIMGNTVATVFDYS